MIRLLKFLILGTSAFVALQAGAFPPVPTEAWAIKVADTAGTGAIYLERQFTVSLYLNETRVRIRILNEAGKSAAEFASFGKDCYDIEGQTVYPDGTVTPFTKKDLQNKTVAKMGSTEIERTVLIPPGLNSDCIIDIQWKESKKYLEMAGWFGAMESHDFSGRFPVKKAIVEVPRTFPWGWSLNPGRALKADKGERKSWVQITLLEIPALEEVPYAIGGARNNTRLLLYPTPELLRYAVSKGPEVYWNDVGRLVLKPWLEDGIGRGRAYRANSEALRKDRPASDHLFASELIKKLDGLVRNTNFLTFEEKSKRTKKDAELEIDSRDLNASFERHFTDGSGMTHLFYEILKDAGIRPKVALVTNRERRIFNQKLLTWTQFDDVLVGVEEGGKGVLWFDPSWRFATPGMINDDYQGTTALSFDTASWKGTVFTVPVQEAKVNQQRSEYVLELGEDEDLFTVRSTYSGLPEWSERRRYLPLELKEQNRLLKERLENHSRKLAITSADVEHASDPQNNVTWKAAGRIERDPGRRRVVEPFPVDWSPVWIPDRLDPIRQELIVLPYAMVHSARSEFRVPAGYRLGTVEGITHRNGFGKVSWSLQRLPKDGLESCLVDLRVEVSNPIAAAQGYPELKEFLGWVREASGRTLILEKVR
jgi:hypothetical protein